MRLVLLAAAAAALLAMPAFAAADPVEGEWLVEAGNAKVHIAPCNGHSLCGVINWLQAPNDANGQPKHDVHNPDPKLQSRPVMGMTMIWNFHQDGPGRWSGGKIYDPTSGKTYDSKLRIAADGTLKVSGCIAFLCKTQTWKRS